ncbi:MAG: hypothetical protein BroJett011_46770 [Chloroflexota bacterium]|nr:MAG: hypothetical protein BroJett011_46770 [Chloroflexota bacterium]
MRKIGLIAGLVLLLNLVWVAPGLAAPSAEGGGLWHTVRYGETLASIGRLYGVNHYAICSANNLGNCNIIWSGQVLWIPTAAPPQSSCVAFHTVTRGQTLYSIGHFYGRSPWAIAAANRIYNLNLIFPGQTLCIPN